MIVTKPPDQPRSIGDYLLGFAVYIGIGLVIEMIQRLRRK